jgi:hypothetical protein
VPSAFHIGATVPTTPVPMRQPGGSADGGAEFFRRQVPALTFAEAAFT